MKNKLIPYFAIAFGASLWGTIALFVKNLKVAGFTEMEIVTVRVTFSAIFLLIIGFIRFRSEMKVNVKSIHLFIGTGILSIVLFNWCYFYTMNQLSVSLAVVLLYTSPAFVVILSFLFLKESLTTKKMIAVIGTMAGCMLIAGMSMENSNVTWLGILTGLGSGLGYALYSIFGKFALKTYRPFTVTLYTFVVATLFLLPFSTIWSKIDKLFQIENILYGAGLALVPTVFAYFIYTWGLEKTESSKAAIIATIEPVVAMIIGITVFGESFETMQMIGSFLILLSVIFVNLPTEIKWNKKRNSLIS